jgi:hypothetical protein
LLANSRRTVVVVTGDASECWVNSKFTSPTLSAASRADAKSKTRIFTTVLIVELIIELVIMSCVRSSQFEEWEWCELMSSLWFWIAIVTGFEIVMFKKFNV